MMIEMLSSGCWVGTARRCVLLCYISVGVSRRDEGLSAHMLSGSHIDYGRSSGWHIWRHLKSTPVSTTKQSNDRLLAVVQHFRLHVCHDVNLVGSATPKSGCNVTEGGEANAE